MAKAKKRASGSGPRTTAGKKKPGKKAAASGRSPKSEVRSPTPAEVRIPESEARSESPRAERGAVGIECAQCHGTIDAGALRIALEAGEALHPACTFGWTLDHFADKSATADFMAGLMQRSRLSPEDRAELLEELDAPAT